VKILKWAEDLVGRGSQTSPSYATAIALTLAGMTPVVGFALARVTSTKWVVALLVVQVVTSLLTWMIPHLQRRAAASQELTAELRAGVSLSDALDPVMEELSSLAFASPASLAEHRARVQTSAMNAAASLIGPDRARVCFFKWLQTPRTTTDPATGERVLKAHPGRIKMAHDQSCGRSKSARAEFRQGAEAGDAAIDMVRKGESLFVADVETDAPAGFNPAERGPYKTFIAVPVKAKSKPLGMLTLDCPNAGDLREEDVDLLRVFAWVVGAALIMGERMSAGRATIVSRGRGDRGA